MGRERELAQLDGHLDDAIDGRGSVVLVAGEAGIGKTTLVDRFVSHAQARGAVVVWGRCPEGLGAPPFAPWLEVVRAWWRLASASEVAALGPARGVVGHVLPELAMELGIESSGGSEWAGAPFRVIEALGETVARAGRVRPMVVVVDDLHAADVSSLAVAESAARAIVDSAVLLIGTYRDTEVSPPLADSVGRLLRLPRARCIPLAGLDEDAVGRCIEATTGIAVSSDIACALWRRSGGNPFFAIELARLGDADGLPPAVRPVLQARLAGFTPDTVRMLETAAVFGSEFRDTWLADAFGLSLAEVVDRLEPVVNARLVEARGIGWHRFVHELVRETLLDGLATVARAELHGRVGETIERLAGETVDEHLDELAEHYSEAARVGPVGRAVEFRERAAQRARRLSAYYEAADHLDHACALAELDPTISAERRCDLLLALGDAWTRVSDFDRSRAAFRRAFDIAQSMDDSRRLAAAAMGHRGPTRLERTDVSIPLLDEALAVIPRADEALRARLVAYRARSVPGDRDDEAREWSEDAWRLARATDDPLTISLAASARGWCSFTPAELDDAVKLAATAAAAGRRSGEVEAALEGLLLGSLAAAIRGEFAELDRLEEERCTEGERLRRPIDAVWGPCLRTRRHLLNGEFGAAERTILDLAELESHLGTSPHTLQLFWLRWWQGRAAELREVIGSIADGSPPQWITPQLLLGLISMQDGDIAGVRSVVGENVPIALSSTRGGWGRPVELTWAAELALAVDDRDHINALREALGEWAGLHAHYTLFFYLGPCDYYLGRLHAALGDDDRASDSLESALAFVDAVRARPQRMITRAALAAVLTRRNRPDDRERSRVLLGQALTLARGMNLPHYAREYEALVRHTPETSAEGLTEREAEVLALVAKGSTNQQIAVRLHMSVKTVERHLSNLYRKLEVTNRTAAAAAAYAVRHPPMSDDPTS